MEEEGEGGGEGGLLGYVVKVGILETWPLFAFPDGLSEGPVLPKEWSTYTHSQGKEP